MPQILTRDCLSTHDQQVLDSIFKPLELTSSVAQAINSDGDNELVDIEEYTEAVQQSKELELKAVLLAEEGELERALESFKEASNIAPTRASVYNNQAQALRLAGRDSDALANLNKAIELAVPNRQSKTQCHALCQRGVLHRKREQLDESRKDFEEAAKMGSHFARSQLVEINPFAALCNQMLRQAFEQLK